MGEAVLADGESERAVSIFRQVKEMAPDNAEVIGGLARALIAAGEKDEARQILDDLPEDLAKQAGDRPRQGGAGGRFGASRGYRSARNAARRRCRRP